MGLGFKTYAVGDEVEAKAKGWKKYFKGKVTGFEAKTKLYTVSFEDGELRNDLKAFHLKGVNKPVEEKEFISPDGTKYKNMNEYRKFLKQKYSIENLEGKSITKNFGDINGKSFSLKCLSKCSIHLLDYTEQIYVDEVKNCTIIIGPCSGPVFLRGVSNTTLYVACKQLRLRDCQNLSISLYSRTEPVVESSACIEVSPYQAFFPNQAKLFKLAGLDPMINQYANVFDFTAADENRAVCFVLPPKEKWIKWCSDVEGSECPVDPHTKTAPVEKEQQNFEFGDLKQPPQLDQLTEVDSKSTIKQKPSLPSKISIEPPLTVTTAEQSKTSIGVKGFGFKSEEPLWSERNLKGLITLLLEIRQKEETKSVSSWEISDLINLINKQAKQVNLEI